MKKIKLYYNERTMSGAVEWKKWDVEPIKNNFAYGSAECLKEIEIEIPENWDFRKDIVGNTQIYDSKGCTVHFKGDYHSDYNDDIYAITSETPFPKKVKIVK